MVIPYIHPVVVHFPIALLIVSVVFAVGWLVSGAGWWRNTLFILTLIGAAGSVLAVESGEKLEEHEEAEYGGWGDREALMHDHEELGEIAMIASIGTAVFYLGVLAFGAFRKRERDPIALRIIGLLATLACAAVVGMAGHKGGLLVWGESPGEAEAHE